MAVNTKKAEAIAFSRHLTEAIEWKRSVKYLRLTGALAFQPTSQSVSSEPAAPKPSYSPSYYIEVQCLCSTSSLRYCTLRYISNSPWYVRNDVTKSVSYTHLIKTNVYKRQFNKLYKRL